MRLFTVTLAYAPARTLRAGIDRYYDTIDPGAHFHHLVVNQHYPLNPNPVEGELYTLRAEYDFDRIDPGKNLGYHHGFNYAMQWLDNHFGLHDDDAILCYDPDSWPVERGWNKAIKWAMEMFPEIGTCGILGPVAREEIVQRGYCHTNPPEAFRSVWFSNQPIIASLQAWRVGFLRKAGGFQEPCKYYGGIEAAMWPHLERQGLKWAVVPDFHDLDHLWADKDIEYRAWQWAHAHSKIFQGDFEEFLHAGKHEQVLELPQFKSFCAGLRTPS